MSERQTPSEVLAPASSHATPVGLMLLDDSGGVSVEMTVEPAGDESAGMSLEIDLDTEDPAWANALPDSARSTTTSSDRAVAAEDKPPPIPGETLASGDGLPAGRGDAASEPPPSPARTIGQGAMLDESNAIPASAPAAPLASPLAALSPSGASAPPRLRLEQLFGTDDPKNRRGGSEALDPIVEIVAREISALGGDPGNAAERKELSARLALLVWDGYGRSDVALPLIAGNFHPVARALRLHATIDSAQPGEALLALSHLERAELAEVAELLLFRGNYKAAAELFARAEADSKSSLGLERLRALTLCLLEKRYEAAALLEKNPTADCGDLLWAAHLYEQADDSEQLERVLSRACASALRAAEANANAASEASIGRFLALERLYGLWLANHRNKRDALLPLLNEKLALLGGLPALSESQPELVVSNARALRRIELLFTAVQLAGLLAEQGTDAADLEAATLYDAVAGFSARHKEAAAPLGRCLALAESARLCERRGERVAAAERFEALGLLLVDLGGLGSLRGGVALDPALKDKSDAATRLDLAAQAAALAYLWRAAELIVPRAGQKLSAGAGASSEPSEAGASTHAAVLYGRLQELGASDEVLALRRLSLLLPLGRDAHTEVVAALAAQAEMAPPSSFLRFAARAARAAEALRVPGADVQGPHSLATPDTADISLARHLLDVEALARRARRRGDHPQLVQLYSLIERWLGRRADHSPRDAAVVAAAAAYQGVAVVLQAGLAIDAHEHDELLALQEIAERYKSRSGGIFTDATRMLLSQRIGSAKAGAAEQTLKTLLARVQSSETQIQLYRQLGHYAAEQAGDLTLAESSFQEVLLRRPDDVMALHALARLLEQRGETAQAVALLQQAAHAALQLPKTAPERPAVASTGIFEIDELLGRRAQAGQHAASEGREVGAQAAALLCCELGALYEQLAHTATEPTAAIDQAVACYSEALRRDPRCRTAARALVVLYRAMQRPAEMLAAMEMLLPLLHDDSQRLGLLLEMGEAAMQQALSLSAGESATREAMPAFELALRAYSEALALHPDNPPAVQHLLLLSRRTQRYGQLAEALRHAPRTLEVLGALREAYENLGETRGLAGVYEDQLHLLLSEGTKEAGRAAISCARALALLYKRLEQPEDEGRTWERLYDLSPEELWNDVPVLLVLERRYGQSGRHAEQAALLSRALEHLSNEQARQPDDAVLRERRHTLLLRLGDVQRDFLGAEAQATATFEQVLVEWPEDPAALRALGGLYGNQGRSTEQLRVLGALLEVSVDPAERSRLLFQLGELDEKQSNLESAYQHYGQAFYLDPSNRGAFTAYERLCYRREQWQEALRIYDTALKLIETQKTRSYRSADLHVRRGQVLLQYLQKTDEALQHYLRALETDAENDGTQATIERIYAGRNQWRELLSAYERRASLVREDMKRVEILRRASRVATAKLRDVTEAVRFYEKLHAVDPTDSEALDALEHHYDRSHDYEKLYGLLSTRVALSVDEQQIIALNMRIGMLCEEGLRDHDRAISAYRHVVEQQPTHREALDAMARLFEANERWAELIDVTRRQIRLVTDRSQKALLYFKCGSVTEAKFGKEDDAIRYYEAAVRTSAACLPALHSLRDIYIRREDWVRVTQTLELESKLWTEDKERAGILAHAGQIYLDKLGADARALEFFEQALSVDKDCLPANRALFQIYFQRGDWERALGASQVLLQKASREGEPSERSEFHRRRALVALHLGHLGMACDSVSAALDIYPENLQVLELLSGLCQRPNLGVDFGPLCRELEKQFRRRELPRCLARVLCAQAALFDPSADVEGNEALLKEAVRLAPDDYLPSEALANLYERLRRFHEAQQVMQSFVSYTGEHAADAALNEARARMQLRLSEMCSTALLNAEQALGFLQPLLFDAKVPPALRREARFRSAQELYVLGRYFEAQREMEALTEETTALVAASAAPASALSEEAARYYNYLGRIFEVQGEDAASQRAYRRAIDLDPTFAQPVLALARRAARSGDSAQAELLMRDALDQLAKRNRLSLSSLQTKEDRSAARLDEELGLRRGIARLLSTFDPQQAADAFLRIIETATQHLPPDTPVTPPWLDESAYPLAAWETLDDRVALADLLLHRLDNANAAQKELQRVLGRDLHHAPAYPLLIELYEKLGQPERAERVQALLQLLGYSSPDGARAAQLLSLDRGPRPSAYRQALSAELRQRYLFPKALREVPYFELLQLTLDGLGRLFPPPWPLPVETEPASGASDADFKLALADAQRLFGLEVEVLFAAQVPGYVLALEPLSAGGPKVVVMEHSILERSDAERRFLLGRAFESLRIGAALLLRLSAGEAAEWLQLCRALLRPTTPQAHEKEGSLDEASAKKAAEFISGLTRSAEHALARLAAASAATADSTLSPENFLAALPFVVDRAGLLFCNDIAAAVRMMARAQGEELALVEGHGGGALLGQVLGGAELVRYYLSDSYHELVSALRDTSRL